MADLTLHASDLLSKWGFGDGEQVDDWWWDEFGEDPPAEDALEQLVEQLLLPVVRQHGHQFKAVRILTIHNPIRLEILNGVPVDWDKAAGADWLDDIWVTVARAEASALVRTSSGSETGS